MKLIAALLVVFPVVLHATTYEGETLSGTFSMTSDSSATGGSCVLASSALTKAPGLGAGGYLFTARVRGATARARLNVDGARVGEFAVTSGWQEFSVPIYLPGSTNTISIQAAPPNGGGATGSLYVDWLQLASDSVGYTTRGNRILDSSGAGYIPRGINLHVFANPTNSFPVEPTFGDHADEQIQWMHNWGVDCVRLNMSEMLWLGTCPNFTQVDTYKRSVDAAVQKLTDKGMMVVLNLHLNTTNSTAAPCANKNEAYPASQSTNWWFQVADRYRTNALVAFELFNEPHDIDKTVWRDGNAIAVGMQKLYDVVRSTGARNLVFIEGIGWGGQINCATNNWIDGYGIVYSPHSYCDPCCACDNLDTNSCDGRWTAVAAEYPVVITEFGSTLTNGNYYGQVIPYAEDKGLGWLAFAWGEYSPGVAQDDDFRILQSFQTYAPSSKGFPVRDGLWTARGWTNYGGVGPDTVLPAAITNLSVTVTNGTNFLLTFTAPGDDGATGRASYYEIRYGDVPITESNWPSLYRPRPLPSALTTVPAPAAAGSTERIVVSGLNTSWRTYFALKTGDDLSNPNDLSPLSNVVGMNTSGARTSVKYNSQELVGPMDLWVSDSTADGGWCSRIFGNIYNVAAVDPGTYKFTVRARGTNAKVRLTVNGVSVGEIIAAPAWVNQNVSGVVISANTDTIGVEPVAITPGLAFNCFIDWIQLAP